MPRKRSVADVMPVVLVVAGALVILGAGWLRTSEFVSSRVTETSITKPLDQPGSASSGDGASQTRKVTVTRAPPSDALLGILIGLGATMLLLGAFYGRVQEIPLPGVGAIKLTEIAPQAFPAATVPAPTPELAANVPAPAAAGDVFAALLAQDALAHLDLAAVRERLESAREIRVAIASVGLDPAVAAHPAFAERVDDPVYVRGAGGHGSLMAAYVGLVAAVAPTARVLPVGVFDASGGGQLADILEGVNVALRWQPDVLFLDAGMAAGEPNQLLPDQERLRRLIRGGEAARTLVLAPAGNEPTDTPAWPAAEPSVLGVAASAAPDLLAPFSARGVPLAAPGSDLLVVAGVTDDQLQFEERSGTSLAAAVATAVAALVLAADPGLDPATASALMIRTGRPIPASPGTRALDTAALANAIETRLARS